jgi:hypothetical protein
MYFDACQHAYTINSSNVHLEMLTAANTEPYSLQRRPTHTQFNVCLAWLLFRDWLSYSKIKVSSYYTSSIMLTKTQDASQCLSNGRLLLLWVIIEYYSALMNHSLLTALDQTFTYASIRGSPLLLRIIDFWCQIYKHKHDVFWRWKWLSRAIIDSLEIFVLSGRLQ